MKKEYIPLVFLAVFLSLMFLWTHSDNPQKNNENTTAFSTSNNNSGENTSRSDYELSQEDVNSELEIISQDCKADEYSRSIVGIIKNNTNKTYSYAQVEYNLYDKDHNQVGIALANINNLEPHGKWKFEASILEDSATTYKLKNISGF